MEQKDRDLLIRIDERQKAHNESYKEDMKETKLLFAEAIGALLSKGG